MRLRPLLPGLAALLLLAHAARAADASPAVRAALAAFPAWDLDHDASLTVAELDLAIASPSVAGESAAAAVALRRVAQNKRAPVAAFTCETIARLVPALRFDDPRDAEEAPDAPPDNRDNLERYYEGTLRKITSTPRALFVGAPSLDGFRQGRLGTCFCLAPLAALVRADPEAVARRFAPSPDGARIAVTFGRDEIVAVSPLTDGEIALGSDTGGNGLWAATYEKAVGQLRRDSATASPAPAAPPYAVATRGGSAGAMLGVLTGDAIRRFSCKAWLPGASPAPAAESARKLDELRALLRAASAGKRLMTAGTSLKTRKVPSLAQNHAYAVLGYDVASDRVIIRDPHGQNFTPKGEPGLEHGYVVRQGVFEVPVAEVVYLMAGFAFQLDTPRAGKGYPASSAATPADAPAS